MRTVASGTRNLLASSDELLNMAQASAEELKGFAERGAHVTRILAVAERRIPWGEGGGREGMEGPPL